VTGQTGHGPEHWRYRALALRLLLAAVGGDDDALDRLGYQIGYETGHWQAASAAGRCPSCAVTAELLTVAANFLTVMDEDGYGVVGHLEQQTAIALDELAGQTSDPGGGTA
jgi:hypothetical protein